MRIIGNQKATKLLDKIVATGKVANAYLFSGPEHVGKFTAALEFAQNLAGHAKVNPNLTIVRPETEEKRGIVKKSNIKIEAIRDLRHKLGLYGDAGKYKAAIIDEAEKMLPAAQNALLKTLEEPNDKVVLILVCQNENKLLPTIVSRCQRIRFGPAGREEIEKLIGGGANSKEILSWSMGRPGVALEIANDSARLESRREMARELADLFSQNLAERFMLAEKWSKNTAELADRLDLWLIVLRESLLGRRFGSDIAQDKALDLMRRIIEGKEAIENTNANPRLILENIFLQV